MDLWPLSIGPGIRMRASLGTSAVVMLASPRKTPLAPPFPRHPALRTRVALKHNTPVLSDVQFPTRPQPTGNQATPLQSTLTFSEKMSLSTRLTLFSTLISCCSVVGTVFLGASLMQITLSTIFLTGWERKHLITSIFRAWELVPTGLQRLHAFVPYFLGSEGWRVKRVHSHASSDLVRHLPLLDMAWITRPFTKDLVKTPLTRFPSAASYCRVHEKLFY